MASHSDGNKSIEQIKEEMKEKRRKKDSNTSWSRSFSKRKGTSASFVLKASLRSNNHSLAKALAASKHETRVAHQVIIDLQRERQTFTHQANMTRRAEKECIHRFNNIQQVLTKVTTSLLDAVTSLSQALDLCSSLPLRDSSLGIMPRASLTSDDDSFGSVEKPNEGSSKLCRKAEVVSTALGRVGSEVTQSAQSVAKVVASLSEPTPETVQLQASIRPSELTENHQPGQTIGTDRTNGSNLLVDDVFDEEMPSLDDVEVPIRFADESMGAKDNGCSSRRQSSLLEPPVKRSRTSMFLDPVAIKKALADDTDGAWTKDSRELDQNLHPEHYAREKDAYPLSQVQECTSAKKDAPVMSRRATYDLAQPGTKARRATYDLPQTTCSPKPPSNDNETFEVTDPTSSSTTYMFIPPTEGKDRYVFVHSPPNTSSYKPVEMELTGEANSSSSALPDDHNTSRISHDDQVIRPWGNIQFDKPNKTKPAPKSDTRMSKSKLAKSSHKTSNKKGSLKESTKIGISKKSKDIKKASVKSIKKTVLLSESFKNDLAVFDLSAGESFSIPSPIYRGIKSKPNETVDTSNRSDEEPTSCYAVERFSDVPTRRSNPNDKICMPVTEGKHQEPVELQEPIHQQEPGHQEHIDQEVHYSPECPESIHQVDKLNPVHDIDKLHVHPSADQDARKKNEKLDSKVIKKDGIKRKSKKARSVKTPSVEKIAVVGDMMEVNSKLGTSHRMPGNVDVFLDGTCTDQIQTGASTHFESDAASVENLEQSKPKKRPAKSKTKTTEPSSVPEILADVCSMLVESNKPTEDLGHENQPLLPKMHVEPSVTFALDARKENAPQSPSSAQCETVDQRVRNVQGRGKGRPRKKICESSDHILTASESVSNSPRKISDVGHYLSLPTDAIKPVDSSPKKQATSKASSKSAKKISKKGQKRMVDALECDELPSVEERENSIQDPRREQAVKDERETIGEEDIQVEETGRRSRRGAPVSYKEPSLLSKMRRDESTDKLKVKKTKKVSKRTTLGAVTNVL